MVGWHHRLDGHGLGWTLGVGDTQGGLACCDSWGRKESDTTEHAHTTTFYSCLTTLVYSVLLFFFSSFCFSLLFPFEILKEINQFSPGRAVSDPVWRSQAQMPTGTRP